MREKLIELLESAESAVYWNSSDKGFIEKIADHLIANGVTFATDNNAGCKWIPVSERLPEVVDSYIVVVKCKYDWEKEYEIGVDIATYDPYSGNPYIDGCWNTYNDWNEGQEYLHVTHWMPLPEPPRRVDHEEV